MKFYTDKGKEFAKLYEKQANVLYKELSDEAGAGLINYVLEDVLNENGSEIRKLSYLADAIVDKYYEVR